MTNGCILLGIKFKETKQMETELAIRPSRTILENLKTQGFDHFLMAVIYKSYPPRNDDAPEFRQFDGEIVLGYN